MSDYISRQDAVDAAIQDSTENRTHSFRAGQARSASRIKALPPADVVQVCRCRNCKYFYEDIGICDNTDALVSPTADGFCSYGERKE